MKKNRRAYLVLGAYLCCATINLHAESKQETAVAAWQAADDPSMQQATTQHLHNRDRYYSIAAALRIGLVVSLVGSFGYLTYHILLCDS